MKILRATGTILFCFLLLLSLSAFGLAFLTKSTVLNADFIARHVSRLEMTALAYEVIDDYAKAQTTIEVEFLKNALHDFFTEKEPWFKEEVNRAIRALYSFLLGKSERLEIEISLDNLKTGLRDSLWHTMQRYLAENASAIPEELLLPYIDTHYQELLPLIPGPLLPPGMAGLEGQALQAYVHEHYTEVAALLQQAYAQPNVAGLILEQLRPYFNQYYNELAARLPQSWTISEEAIPQEVMEQLRQARQIVRYFMMAYYALIGITVVFIAIIFLINMNVKDFARAVGAVLFIYGIAVFAGVIFARNFDFLTLMSGIPHELQLWLAALVRDALSPLQWFSLGVLILGLILIIISIVVRSKEKEAVA